MKTRVIFTFFFVLVLCPVFAQSSPVVVTPITNGFTVNFTLPSYTLKDTTLAEVFEIQ